MGKYDTDLRVEFAGDSHTRGLLRTWKAAMDKRYDPLNRLMDAHSLASAATDMVFKKGTGRRRAFDKLQRLIGSAAALDALRLDGSHPIAVWSSIKPRTNIRLDKDGYGVTVNYLVAGKLPDQNATGEGTWTLELPDHALGRIIQRHGIAHLEATIRDAHRTLLCLNHTTCPSGPEKRFCIQVGNGFLVCYLQCGEDVSLDLELCAHVVGVTYLDDGLTATATGPRNLILLKPTAKLGERWADSLLMPAPLRWISQAGKRLKVQVWGGGMPELIRSKP